jgi:hypothetical protein
VCVGDLSFASSHGGLAGACAAGLHSALPWVLAYARVCPTWRCVGGAQWEPIIIPDGPSLYLIMALDRDDFNKEIDRTYQQVGIALSIGAPIAVLLTAFSTCGGGGVGSGQREAGGGGLAVGSRGQGVGRLARARLCVCVCASACVWAFVCVRARKGRWVALPWTCRPRSPWRATWRKLHGVQPQRRPAACVFVCVGVGKGFGVGTIPPAHSPEALHAVRAHLRRAACGVPPPRQFPFGWWGCL